MGRTHALAATLICRLLPLPAVLLLLLMPGTVLADGLACSVTGSSTSGGTVDLLRTPIWHLRSTDHVTVTAVAPAPQADVAVSVYAFGVAIPVATGVSSGGDTIAEADYDVSSFAPFGRVFVVSGRSSGAFAACGGDVEIVLDDVSPFATGLGIGAVAISLIGLLGILGAVRKPLSRGRRVASLVSLLLLLAGLTLLIQQTTTPGEPASLGPSPMAAAVPGIGQVMSDPVTLAEIAGLALLVVVLLPFPAELFNRTLEQNLDRIRAFLRQVPLLGRLAGDDDRPPTGGAAHVLGILAFLLVAGLLYSLLNPTFGPDARTAVAYAGILAALVAMTWLHGLPMRAAHRASSADGSDRGRLRAVAATLLVGIACVAISRWTGFLPGYLYGLVIGYVYVRELDSVEDARAHSAAAWWTLGLAVICWLMLSAARAPGVGDTAAGQILGNVLATVTVAGIEGIAFGLVPLRFLPGERIFRWSRLNWGVPYGLGLFFFIWIILNPANGFTRANDQAGVVTAAALFIGFGLASVLFWAYFRLRPTAEAPPAT